MLNQQEKQELLQRLQALYATDDYAAMVKILEEQGELDLELALQLVRAYLNLHNVSGDDFALQRAADILDTFEDTGHNDAMFLYLKALLLLKENLIHDAIIRLQRALHYVPLTDTALFERIRQQLSVLQAASRSKELSPEVNAVFTAHCREHFGEEVARYKGSLCDILIFAPTEERKYYLAVTCGLSAQKVAVPAGVDDLENSYLELVMALPEGWPIDKNDLKYYYPFRLMFDLVSDIALSGKFAGFGYTLDAGAPLAPQVRFTGAMLTAAGSLPLSARSLQRPDGYRVNFFYVLPLYPMEIAFRQHGSAQDLIALLQQRSVLCPLYEDRKDALAPVDIKTQVKAD